MKNLFGVMPGIYYGWPKNVLRDAGIENSILDINATLKSHFAIVYGIVKIESDGLIMGNPKQVGVLVMGRNLARSIRPVVGTRFPICRGPIPGWDRSAKDRLSKVVKRLPPCERTLT